MRRVGRSIRTGAVAGLRLLPSPRTTPFTFWYLGLLALTTVLLHFGRPVAVHRLLALSSTDAANLERHPVRVLFLSALWLQDAHWLLYATVFTIVLAPLERRIGSWRTVLVFACGHVLASLATELPVLWAVRGHLLPAVDAHLLDVGVSYGLCAAAGALLLLVAAPGRWWALAGLGAVIVTVYLLSGPASTGSVVTVIGHALSLGTGMLGWLPWARRRGLIGSLRWPRPLTADPTTVLTPAITPNGYRTEKSQSSASRSPYLRVQ